MKPTQPTDKPSPQKALLVDVYSDSRLMAEAQRSLAELHRLTQTAGGEVVQSFLWRQPKPIAATWITPGHVQMVTEIIEKSRENEEAEPIELVIFNRTLSSGQFRNLEKVWEVQVLDRPGLILDIFAQRAQTKDGRLQVELAQLNYLLPRLRGSNTQLSRLGGGIGTRGPGETKLEVDLRRIRNRIHRIEEDLKKVRSNRQVQRQKRRRDQLQVALVGYTNSGKSTLLNRMTGAGIHSGDRLFDTLDPTTRRCRMEDGNQLLMSDTVGFIQDLPHTLIKAFQATLEEAIQSDGLVLVVDVGDPDRTNQIATVRKVLGELEIGDKPIVTAFNKIDAWDDTLGERGRLENEFPDSVFISAVTGEGIERLAALLTERFCPQRRKVRLFINDRQGEWLGDLNRLAWVSSSEAVEGGIWLEAEVPESLLRKLELDGIRPEQQGNGD